MSSFSKVRTKLKDLACLQLALVQVGLPEGAAEVFEKPQTLANHWGSGHGVQKAEIVIRSRHLKEIVGSSASDAGFRMQADGTYELVVNDMDQRVLGGKWLEGLQVEYDVAQARKIARRLGYRVVSSSKNEETGEVDLTFEV